MPTTLNLNDPLAAKVAALEAQTGPSLDAFVERMLQELVDADVEICDGIPVRPRPRC